MSDKIGPLPEALRDLVQHERAVETDPCVDRDAVRSSLAATLALPALGATEPASGPGVAGAGTKLAAGTVAKGAAIGLATLAAFGLGVLTSRDDPSPDQLEPLHETIVTAPVEQTTAPMEPASAVPAEREKAQARFEERPTSQRESAPVEAVAAVPAPTASEEELLRDAWQHVGQAEPRAALAVLRRHADAYPNGVLAEERDALEVRALVDAGMVDEAYERANAFQQRYPDSIHASSVIDAMATIP